MLHLLDNGFDNTEIMFNGPGGEVIPSESDVVDGKVVIGKFPKKAGKLARWIKEDSFGVVYMMRDPRDVLVSKHWLKPNKYWVPPKRWPMTAEIAYGYKDHERFELVKYEELLTNPNAIQSNIAARFGLKVATSFDECYKNFNKEDDVNLNNMNGARPLDPSRIGNWSKDPKKKAYIKRTLNAYPDIEKWMKHFGYH